MFNNLTGLIIKVDKILLAAAMTLALVTIIFAYIRNTAARYRASILLKIKRNLQYMLSIGRGDREEAIPEFVDEYSPRAWPILFANG